MSKGLTRREYNDVRLILSSEYGVPLEVIPAIKDLPLGKILGTVYLANCVTESDSRWFCGEYGFVLRDAIALAEPVVCAGGLGFWEVPAGLLPFADSK